MKRCGKCGEHQSPDAFPFRNKAAAVRHTVCKTCQREYVRRYHRKDKAGYNTRRNARMIEYRARDRAYVERYLRAHPCIDCGISDTVVLEFDHVRGTKRESISVLVSVGTRLSTLQEEIAKCVVRCANCHRRRTAQSWHKRGAERWEEGLQAVAAD